MRLHKIHRNVKQDTLMKGKIMNQRNRAFLAALTAAVLTVACAPNDAEISTKVRTNLTTDETVKAAQIEIGVNKKIVTLSGQVDTPGVKNRAVELARKTDGVADVVDQLKVRELGFGPGHGREMMGRGKAMEEHNAQPREEKRQ